MVFCAGTQRRGGIETRGPLVVFALDSANLDLLEKWVGEERLPHLASLLRGRARLTIEGGCYDEGGSWVSAWSGIHQKQHGFYSGRRLVPGGYRLETCFPEQAAARPFWSDFAERGLRAAILEPPESYVCPGVPGLQLVRATVHQERYARGAPQGEPARALEELLAALGGHSPLRFDRFGRRPAYYREELRKNLDLMRRRCAAYRALLGREPYDLVVIGFNETHDPAHLLWPFHRSARREDGAGRELADGVLALYEAMDREIGRFLDVLPSGATVALASVYGIKTQYPTAALGEALLRKLGHQVTRKASESSGPLGLARRVLPEGLRHSLSQYLPFGVQEALLRRRFADRIDFARSTAFAVPSLYTSLVRVNLKGREPLGIVAPGDYDELLDQIEADFRQLVDPVTGEPAVSSVLRPVDPREDPVGSTLPDLFVHWRPGGHLVKRVVHPGGELRQPKPGFLRDSYHGLPGFLFLSGAGAARCASGTCSVLDLAPTFLDLLGHPPSPAMPGRTLLAAPLPPDPTR